VTTADARESDVSLIQLAQPAIRRWKMIAAIAFGFAVVGAIYVLLQRPVYTAKATFTPETSVGSDVTSGLAGLAGLAGQLGLGGGSSVSPDFFAAVIHSRELLRSTLQTGFQTPGSNGNRLLLDILKVSGRSPAERLARGTTMLERQTRATVERRTGIVTLGVEMPSADLAAQVANRIVALLNEFNLERRQSQSREQRRFTGDRLEQARSELRDAEQSHLNFLQRNRTYQGSPVLMFEANRLAREVAQKQEVVLTLSKAHEEARIAEVRDTPVLTVIDPAVAPVLRTRPRRTLEVIVAALLGTIVGIAAAFVLEYRARRPSGFELPDAPPIVRKHVPNPATASHS
jgi:uncharacterized protein involved in exopolysaccharide biosynthesis